MKHFSKIIKAKNVHYKINKYTRYIDQNTLGLFVQLPIV